MVGRTIISLIATSDGCSIANAMARAMLGGSIPILLPSTIADFNSKSEMDSSNTVVIVPGEIMAVRILLLASSIRRPSVMHVQQTLYHYKLHQQGILDDQRLRKH